MRFGVLVALSLASACTTAPRQPPAPDYAALLAAVEQQLDAFRASLPAEGPASCPWRAQRALLAPDGCLVKVWLAAPGGELDLAELLLRDAGDGVYRGGLAARLPVAEAAAGKPLPRPVAAIAVPRTVLLGSTP